MIEARVAECDDMQAKRPDKVMMYAQIREIFGDFRQQVEDFGKIKQEEVS